MLSQSPAKITSLDKMIDYLANNPVKPEQSAAAIQKIQAHVCTNYFFSNNEGGIYKEKYIAQTIENVLCGVKCMIAWAIQNMQFDNSQWIIHYTNPQFKLLRVVANRLAVLGFPCENIALVNDPSMKKTFGEESEENDALFYPADGPVYQGHFYGSKRMFLSRKIKPLQKLDCDSKIIIPLNYHLKSWLGNSFPTVVKNYQHILNMHGLTTDQITLFFGMFDGMDSETTDNVEHIEFYREHEANFLREIEDLNINVQRFSSLSKGIYYSLADEIISNMLIDQFDLIKGIFATDVMIYMNDQGHACRWNLQQHPQVEQTSGNENSSPLQASALYDIGSAFSNFSDNPSLVLLNLEVALFSKLERIGRDLKLVNLYAKFASYLILNFGLQNVDWTFVATVKTRMDDLPNRIDLSLTEQRKVRKIYQLFLNKYLAQTYLTSKKKSRPTSATSDDIKNDSENEKGNLERTVAATETETPVTPHRGITLFSVHRQSVRSNFIEGTTLENMLNDIFMKTLPPNILARKVAAGLSELEEKYNKANRP